MLEFSVNKEMNDLDGKNEIIRSKVRKKYFGTSIFERGRILWMRVKESVQYMGMICNVKNH